MELIIKVEGATRYSFQDDKTGRQVEGVNVYYLQDKNNENSVGKIPQKVTLPIESWESVSKIPFPSDCELISEQRLGNKGVYTKVTGIKPSTKKPLAM